MNLVKSLLTLSSLLISFASLASWTPTESQLEKLEADLIAFESVRYCPYVGLNGVMTIGVGQAIGTSYEVTRKNRTYRQVRLWSLDRINSLFETAGVHQMTSGQYKQIVKLNKRTNSILRKPSYRIGSYYKKQPRYNVYCLSKTDDDKELLKLLRHSVSYHITAMSKQAEKLDIDLADLPDEVIEFVFDLFYRGGPRLVLGPNTPSINKAINDRDYLKLFQEGFARSNANKNKQNDIRNAYYTALGMKLLSTKDKLKFKRFLKSNKNAKDVNTRIAHVVNNSPESIPDHAKKQIINLALHKNVFIK